MNNVTSDFRSSTSVKVSLRVLLSQIIDYAGLFPPAKLSMQEAVANYATYRKSPHSWMLARFIVPSSRIEEFVTEAEKFFHNDEKTWEISVIADEELQATIEKMRWFNQKLQPKVRFDVLEMRIGSVCAIEEAAEIIPKEFVNYFEIPVDDDLSDVTSTLSLHKQRAKIRTGGLTPDAFPTTEQVIKFMRTCLAANVPFKATAGLHHPIRCRKPLTYEPDAPVGTMFGFLNVFVAAAFARNSLKLSLLHEILEDENPENFVFDDEGIYWRKEYFVSNWHLSQLREKAAISFGSCSFEEPVADLQELKLID